MTPAPAWFDATRCERALEALGCSWGHPLVAVEATTSTNDLALDAEREGVAQGATFVAREQTRGRGRRGNPWWAPPGNDLTCSMLLRPNLDAGRTHALPLVVGLAVREVVAGRIGSSIQVPPVLLKWPNDVWVGSRKIAGVLVESRLRGTTVSAAIVGVGLNVHTLTFPEELAGSATSLARELRPRRRSPRNAPSGAPEALTDPPLAFEELLAELLHCLQRRYERFLRDGFESFLPELTAADALRGRSVRVDEITGIASGITARGALRVCNESGAEREIHAGHVTLLDGPAPGAAASERAR